MPEIPVLSSREVIRTLEKLGWRVVRRRAGHIVLVKDGSYATLSVPDSKEVSRETLRSLIRGAGLTPAEFLERLKD